MHFYLTSYLCAADSVCREVAEGARLKTVAFATPANILYLSIFVLVSILSNLVPNI